MSNIKNKDYWVTENAYTIYQNAINEAKAFIQNTPQPTAGALQQSISALKAATTMFERAMAPGLK